MNPHVNYAAVGLFVVVGVIGLIALAMWLGKAGDATPMRPYVVQIHGNVNGLSNGSAVRYLGVDVGSVTDIVLDTDGEPTVEVFIEIEQDLPVNEHTYATLVAQGVTGIANIDLANDPDQKEPLRMHARGVPIIPYRPSGLAALLSGTGDIAAQASQLLVQLNELTGADSREAVRRILANLGSLSDALAAERESLPTLLDSIERTLAHLEKGASGFERAMEEDWPVLASNLKRTSASLSASSSRIEALLAKNEESIDELLSDGLTDAAALARELRSLADDLSQLAARLREDPSRIIYRPASDGVEVPP